MPDYRLTNEAKDDLLRIYEYGTFTFGINQADKYLNDFFDCFELIASQPYAFESVDQIKIGYRRCFCGVDSIFYRIENDMVEIMTIVGKQDIDKIFKQ
jgi:toxin ParE1/3/4